MERNYKSSYKVSRKQLVSLSVYNVGFEKCQSLHQWGPGVRDHYLIHYVISGKGMYISNDKEYNLKCGDAFIVYPSTEVIYTADKSDPWEYAWVGFSGADASNILASTDFKKENPIIEKITFSDKLLEQIHKIYDCRGNEFEHSVEMTGYLYTLLALFMQNSKQKDVIDASTNYVQKSIEYIASNYSYKISVEDIAAYTCISRSHLFRSFETVLGISPKEYLTDFRIRQACLLLENTSLSITAIANSVGFDNSLYFSKTFHLKKGLSPKEYRKNLVLNEKKPKP